MRRFFAVQVFLFLTGAVLWSQAETDPVSLVGLNLETLVGRCGVPRSVYAVRGLEEWQDDVVFSYPWADLYVYNDHVWQVKPEAVFGFRAGDHKAAVLLVFGDAAVDYGGYLLCRLEPSGWPMMLRCSVDGAGKITAIYIYRSDL
jgi:hypothetical protein